MKWIAEYYKPDPVLIPIGGHFTMDRADAAYALRELIQAPGSTAIKVLPLKPGEQVDV